MSTVAEFQCFQQDRNLSVLFTTPSSNSGPGTQTVSFDICHIKETILKMEEKKGKVRGTKRDLEKDVYRIKDVILLLTKRLTTNCCLGCLSVKEIHLHKRILVSHFTVYEAAPRVSSFSPRYRPVQ